MYIPSSPPPGSTPEELAQLRHPCLSLRGITDRPIRLWKKENSPVLCACASDIFGLLGSKDLKPLKDWKLYHFIYSQTMKSSASKPAADHLRLGQVSTNPLRNAGSPMPAGAQSAELVQSRPADTGDPTECEHVQRYHQSLSMVIHMFIN